MAVTECKLSVDVASEVIEDGCENSDSLVFFMV